MSRLPFFSLWFPSCQSRDALFPILAIATGKGFARTGLRGDSGELCHTSRTASAARRSRSALADGVSGTLKPRAGGKRVKTLSKSPRLQECPPSHARRGNEKEETAEVLASWRLRKSCFWP